ncbi:MAG: 1-acyl-sn-glycerol-3-phosphate acyltransferase [Bacteroidales bacterium]|jgi:1-acyl-sn-glycerol-3-phosphate acyltransferase|nr:1-acyl-sn-glycerol-3-phosphate acyltransferase [Bacteroidales bacterium]
MEVPEKLIDISEVIRKKNPKLLKILPNFCITGMKRLIHQDEVNRIIDDYRDRFGLDFVRCILEDMKVSYTVTGMENVPTDGRYIFASNHPLGGFDGLVLMDAIGKTFPNIRFIVNDILLNLKNFDPIFVPVNKHGRQPAEYARKIDETYSGDYQVLNFPAGLCSRKIKGKITDLKWNKNFIQKALHYKRDVVPVYFEGHNSGFFYGLANLRKTLHIKSNIEMTFLVDEFFKQKGRHLKLTFAPPVPYTHFDSSKPALQWADSIRQQVYSMQA